MGSYCTKQRANGAYHRPIYRCYNGAVEAKGCDGQAVYSALKIESAVLEVVRQYFHQMSRGVDSVWKEQARIQLRSKNVARLKAVKAEYAKLQSQQTALRQEVMKSLTDESTFDTELLKEMLEENKQALAAAEKQLADCEAEKEAETAQLQYLTKQYQYISDWAEEFETANSDTKKMILAKIIEKITVDRNYHINISFYLSEEMFRQQISETQPDIQITEADRCITTVAF